MDADLPLMKAINAAQRYFLPDYFACRNDFRDRIQQLSCVSSEILSWDVIDVDAVLLSTDAVLVGPVDAPQTLLLISGTHGVEGFVGSAIQRFILECLITKPIEGGYWNILILHALNPWGMRRARRCDQNGIDLNRNFIDFSHLPPIADDYQSFLDVLSINDGDSRRDHLRQLQVKWGQTYFDRIISGGQYQHDWAPFYGGSGPAMAQKILDQLIAYFSIAQQRLVVIDLHSGLGPYGFGELISDHPASSRANDEARQIFGHALAVTDQGESFSVSKTGLMDYRWHRLMQHKGCFLTLEFGTLGTQALFEVLINDHLSYRSGEMCFDDAACVAQRRAMLEHFCPADPIWQQSVLFRAWQVVYQVLGSNS